jgi:hypothetical protein
MHSRVAYRIICLRRTAGTQSITMKVFLISIVLPIPSLTPLYIYLSNHLSPIAPHVSHFTSFTSFTAFTAFTAAPDRRDRLETLNRGRTGNRLRFQPSFVEVLLKLPIPSNALHCYYERISCIDNRTFHEYVRQ